MQKQHKTNKLLERLEEIMEYGKLIGYVEISPCFYMQKLIQDPKYEFFPKSHGTLSCEFNKYLDEGQIGNIKQELTQCMKNLGLGYSPEERVRSQLNELGLLGNFELYSIPTNDWINQSLGPKEKTIDRWVDDSARTCALRRFSKKTKDLPNTKGELILDLRNIFALTGAYHSIPIAHTLDETILPRGIMLFYEDSIFPRPVTSEEET